MFFEDADYEIEYKIGLKRIESGAVKVEAVRFNAIEGERVTLAVTESLDEAVVAIKTDIQFEMIAVESNAAEQIEA